MSFLTLKRPAFARLRGRTKRNLNLRGENLRKYRGHKTRKGQHRIRKVRYPLQAGDMIMVDGEVYRCGGNSNKGAYVIIKVDGKTIRVKPQNITSLRKRKGMVAII